jgi:hypothetical protein
MKLADSDHVLRAIMMEIGAGDLICTCDLKMAGNNVLFLCPAGYEVGDELAIVRGVRGCKMVSLRAVRIVWTRAVLFMGPTML